MPKIEETIPGASFAYIAPPIHNMARVYLPGMKFRYLGGKGIFDPKASYRERREKLFRAGPLYRFGGRRAWIDETRAKAKLPERTALHTACMAWSPTAFRFGKDPERNYRSILVNYHLYQAKRQGWITRMRRV